MTIKIAYDYQAFSLTSYSGISRYFYEISKLIEQSEDCEVNIVAPLHKNQYIQNSPSDMVVGRRWDRLQELAGVDRSKLPCTEGHR